MGWERGDTVNFIIVLDNNKDYYERSAYTFLTLLGDFGGFNDAIFFLISLFLSSYSAKMYMATVVTQITTP